MHVIQTDRQPDGYESITVSDTAIGFTPAEIFHKTGLFAEFECKEVFCSLETESIRYCTDGTTATTSVGHLVTAGQTITIKNKQAIKNFSAFRDGQADGTLHVTYFF